MAARPAPQGGRARPTRIAAALLAPTLVGLVGAWLALSAFGGSTVGLGPFRVELASGFGRGTTDIALPPFGRVSADTHLAPVHFTATLEDVGVARLTRLLRRSTTQDIVDRMAEDFRAQVVPFALRSLGVAVAGALVLALLVFRTAWRRVGTAVVATALVASGSGLAAWRTFDPSAFRQPTYSGSIGVAAELIGPVRRATARIADFREELGRIVDGALRAYTSIRTSPLAGAAGPFITVLHISDVHLSPLGLEFARRVARGFDVDFVIDTGDLQSFGTPPEQLLLSLIPGFDRPYVFVRGNHDSLAFQRAVAGVPNAVVLDGRAVSLSGLTVYGLGHPVFTPDKRPPLEDEAFERLTREAAAGIEADLAALPGTPDIVAVHDDRMVDALAGRIPLVISGHFHQPSERTIDGTVFLRIGSTGGSGATVFTMVGGVPLSVEILYFQPGTPPVLVAYDVVEQRPETGSLTVDRHLVGEEEAEPTPSPTATPTSGRSP